MKTATRVFKDRFANIEDADRLRQRYAIPQKAVCVTASDYHRSVIGKLNDETGKAIDNGGEPHLINRELADFDMHAQVPIYDIMIDVPEPGTVEFDLPNGSVVVPGDTLVVLI